MFIASFQYNRFMIIKKKILPILLVCLCFPVNAQAQLEFLKGYKDKYISDDQGPGAEKKSNSINNNKTNYIYETPSVKALSHLYWAVNLYDLSDDDAVDEFMRLNECDIYKNFSSDEFEWSEIRDATRDFIKENKNDFPTRFEFMLPIKFGDYKSKRKAFEVQKPYKIDAIRRFEVYATDFRARTCVSDVRLQDGYPRALVLEYSRPFTLTHVPVDQKIAEDYIKRNKIKMKKYDERIRTKAKMYELRDAYVVMKVKIFTHGKFMGLNSYSLPVVQMMAVLEGYEVYGDRYKKNLFFAESYVVNKNKDKLNIKLQDEYDVLLERSRNNGVLHNL